MDPNQFAQMLDQQGQIPAMVSEVARRKALAVVLASATVTDTDGNVVDLGALNPRSGDEADAADAADDAAESLADADAGEQA